MSRAYRLIRATCVYRQKDKPADISTIMVKKDEANSFCDAHFNIDRK